MFLCSLVLPFYDIHTYTHPREKYHDLTFLFLTSCNHFCIGLCHLEWSRSSHSWAPCRKCCTASIGSATTFHQLSGWTPRGFHNHTRSRWTLPQGKCFSCHSYRFVPPSQYRSDDLPQSSSSSECLSDCKILHLSNLSRSQFFSREEELSDWTSKAAIVWPRLRRGIGEL